MNPIINQNGKIIKAKPFKQIIRQRWRFMEKLIETRTEGKICGFGMKN